MGTWNDLQEPPAHMTRLRSAIDLLAHVHSKRLSDEATGHWLKRLLPYAKGSALWRAMEAACDERGFPSLHWVLEQITIQQRQDTKPFEPIPELTPEQRIRADAAAIKSALWLHYEHDHGARHVGGIVQACMARLFAAQVGKPIDEALEEAKRMPGHDRAAVAVWMQNQEAIGN